MTAPDRTAAPTVLCVLPGVTPDAGTEQSFLATAPALVAAGVRLHLAVLTDRQQLVPALERAGVVVHDLSPRRGTLGTARAVRRVLRSLAPDVVHATLHDATVPTQLAAIGSGVPVLVTWANVTYGAARDGEPGVDRRRLEVLRGVEAILGRCSGSWYQAVTPEVAELTAAAVHAPAGRVLVGERGRDPGRFPCRDGPPRPPPPDLGSAPGARLLVAVGRQEPQKDHVALVEVFDRLAARRADVELVVVGRPGSATPALAARVAASPHAARIHLLGHRDDVVALLHAASVVVCTSRREGAAGALVEAMAAGAPVVSRPVPGLDGVLVDGVNALVAPLDRLDAAVAAVLDDEALAGRLAAAGRADFERRFTVDAAAAALLDIYRTVSASPRPRRRATHGPGGA